MGKNSHANPRVVVSVRCVIDLKYWVKCQSIVSVEWTPEQNTQRGKWEAPSVLGVQGRLPGGGGEHQCREHHLALRGARRWSSASNTPGRPVPPTYRKRNRGAEKLTTLPRWHSKVPGPGVTEKMGRKGKIGRAKSCGGLNVRLGVGWADDIDMNLISYLLQFVEDVGDEGEEEKEFISYNINIDIHYGVKSNR